ncbi:MAG TPA: alpha/beta fold hydrolase [Nocardioidaceae bacterium]|nr:alpha/beta fold hydrolase [Nocardioidaceae bacterium]
MVGQHQVTMPWGTLSYTRAGTGAPLLLVHSLALSGRMWQPTLDDFAAAHDVIAVDLRGHGASEWDGRQFSVDDLADDLRQLLDHLGIERAHVLGLSMGGSVATLFAINHGDRLDRLILADTTSCYGPDAPATWEARAAAAESKPRERQIPFQITRWYSDDYPRLHAEEVSRVVGIFLRTNPRAHAQACRALGALDARERLGKISAPTTVLVGAEDYATPPAMAQVLSEGIPGATLQVWPRLRHFGILESADMRRTALAALRGEALPPVPAARADGLACCQI